MYKEIADLGKADNFFNTFFLDSRVHGLNHARGFSLVSCYTVYSILLCPSESAISVHCTWTLRKRPKGVVQTRIKLSLVKVNKQTRRTEELTYWNASLLKQLNGT